MDIHQDMPTLAGRGDLAPRARRLLAQQLAECDAFLDPLVRGALGDLEQELFRIAEKSSSGHVQHEAFDARELLKHTRERFKPRLMAALEARFGGIGRPDPDLPRPDSRGGDDLALVEPEELEETMALDDLAARGELRAGNGLADLGHRYAVLIAAPPLAGAALPPGPHALAEALAQAATDLGLGRAHRLLFYRLCDRRLMDAAEPFYIRLNECLRDAGILRNLKSYHAPRQQRADRRPTPSDPREQAADATPLAPAVDYTAPAEPRAATSPTFAWLPQPAVDYTPSTAPRGMAADFSPLPEPAMGELHGLLDARRHALHPGAPPVGAGTAQVATAPELQQALASLQALHLGNLGPRAGGQLTEEFDQALRRAAPDGGEVRLPPEQRDALDLIGLLYDQLIPATRADSTARQLLGGLQVPLLRVALTDSNFFTVRSHPARRLLNLVLDTASLWLDRSGERADPALKLRLQRSVQRLADDYQGDLAVIEREADDLEAHLRVLSRRAEIAERRQVEAATGRDKLQEARATARGEVGRRLAAHPAATPLVRTLLENAWTDALTLVLLRKGAGSEPWRRWLGVVDRLLDPKSGRDEEALARELRQGLAQVGIQSSEAELMTAYALGTPPPADSAYRAAPPSQTELMVRLKSRRTPAEEQEKPAANAGPRLLPMTPSERRALETLEHLPFGTWMDFTVNQQGETVAYKLAWYGPKSGHCLLVNARGTAAPQRTMEQVARLMARGQIRVAEHAAATGLLDRAWSALLAGLRKFSVGDVRPEPVT